MENASPGHGHYDVFCLYCSGFAEFLAGGRIGIRPTVVNLLIVSYQ
jgi:hypothetical protein